jgi:tetratricopeptide (TPR) repeat protein
MRIRSRSWFTLRVLAIALACSSTAIGSAGADSLSTDIGTAGAPAILSQPVTQEVAQALRLEEQASDLAAKGRAPEAEPLYRQSLATIEQSLPDDPILAGSLNNVANFYMAQRRFIEAADLLERALPICVSAYGDNHTVTAKVINNLARAYLSDRKYEKAEPLYARGLAATETLLGPDHYSVAISLDWLAQTHFFQHRYALAEKELTRGIAVAEKSTGPDSQLVVRLLDLLISVVGAQGRVQEATAIKEHAQQIIAKTSKP